MKRHLVLAGVLAVAMAACNPAPTTLKPELERFASLSDGLQPVALMGGQPMALRTPMETWMNEAPEEVRLHWIGAVADADSMLALAGLQDLSEETLFAVALGQNEDALAFSSGPYAAPTVERWMDRLEADEFAPGRWRLSPPENSGSLLMDLTSQGDLVGRASPGSLSAFFSGMSRGVRDLDSGSHTDRENGGEYGDDEGEGDRDEANGDRDEGQGDRDEGQGEHRDDALDWELQPIDREVRRGLLAEVQTDQAWLVMGEIPELRAFSDELPPQASRLLRAIEAIAVGAGLDEESARARVLLVPQEGVDVEDLASVVRGVVAAMRPGQPEDVRAILDELSIDVDDGRVALSATLDRIWVLEMLARR